MSLSFLILFALVFGPAAAQTEAHDEDEVYQYLYAHLRNHHNWDKEYLPGFWGSASCDQQVSSRIRLEDRADRELQAGDKGDASNDYRQAADYRNTCAVKVWVDACWPAGAHMPNPICEGPWEEATQWNRLYEGMDYYGMAMSGVGAHGLLKAAYLFYYNLLCDKSMPLSPALGTIVRRLAVTTERTFLMRFGYPLHGGSSPSVENGVCVSGQ